MKPNKLQRIYFRTSSYKDFHNPIEKDDINGKYEIKTFPDGEYYMCLDKSLQDKLKDSECIIITGTVSDRETLELYDLANTLIQYGCKKLKIHLLYYGYSTMERSVKWGECVTAKTRANLLSSIPLAPYGTKFYMYDLHAEGITYYFNQNVQTYHQYCKEIIKKMCLDIYGKRKDWVLASADSGRVKWIESLAKDIGVNSAFIFKQRISGSETKVTGINADVEGKDIIIFDDMIRSGSSLIGASAAYKEKGCKNVHIVATHGVFCCDGIKKLADCKNINSVNVINTYPMSKMAEQYANKGFLNYYHLETFFEL